MALAVGVVVAAVGLWAQNESLVGVNYDDAIYVLLAKSVAAGEGYGLSHLPVDVPGVKYPPLYPLSLVPFWVLAGSQGAALYAMKLANGLYIGVAAGLFAFLLLDLGLLVTPLALGVALIGFLAGSIMLVSSGLLSEPLYLALLFLSLWLTDRTDEQPGVGRLIAIGVLAALVFLTRSIGVALLAAVVFAVWYRHGRRSALSVAGTAGLVILPWVGFVVVASGAVPDLLVPSYGSYGQLYLALVADSPLATLDVVAANVGAILQTLGGKLLPELGAVAESLVGTALLGFALLGSRRVVKKAPATATYIWFYLFPISLWVFPPFRFVFILFPLVLALGIVGFLGLAERAGEASGLRWRGRVIGERRWANLAILAAAAALLVHQAYLEVGSVRARVWDGAQLVKSAAGEEVIDWVIDNTEPDDVVAFEFDPLVALHTGRTVAPNNYQPVHIWYSRGESPVEELARLFREMGVRYVAVRRYVAAASGPLNELMGRYPGGLELIHITPGGVLVLETHRAALEVPSEAP